MALYLLKSELLVSNIGQAASMGRGDSLHFARSTCWDSIVKVSRIGLADVWRLGQWLNVPTQGQRVAHETVDERPFSLTTPGIEPGPPWWEVVALPIGQLSSHNLL